jgi:hypothetical protein
MLTFLKHREAALNNIIAGFWGAVPPNRKWFEFDAPANDNPKPKPLKGAKLRAHQLENRRKRKAAQVAEKMKKEAVRDKERAERVAKANARHARYEKKFHSHYQEPRYREWVQNKKVEPNSAFESGRAFCSRLRRKGWKILGSGAFSTVLVKPGQDRVIKITSQLDNWWTYVKWAEDNGWGGKFAPKVYSYKFFPEKKEKEVVVRKAFSVAVMERLDRTTSDLKWTDKHCMTSSMFECVAHVDNDNIAQCVEVLEPGLADFARAFRKRFPRNVWGWDLHGGNYMLRKDGTFVLTDPLTGDPDRAPKARYKVKKEVKLAA